MPTYTPVWLAPADVAAWLRVPDTDPTLAEVSAATEPLVERARPDMFSDADPPVYEPDAQVYRAAVMVAARLFRRRNSPGGQEMWADGSVAYIASRDPDIAAMLRIGPSQVPGVG